MNKKTIKWINIDLYKLIKGKFRQTLFGLVQICSHQVFRSGLLWIMHLFISNPPMILSASHHPDPLIDLNAVRSDRSLPTLSDGHMTDHSTNQLTFTAEQAKIIPSTAGLRLSRSKVISHSLMGLITLILVMNLNRWMINMGSSLNMTQIWIELFVFAAVLESVSVDFRGSRCGGIKASARGSWSRQSSSCSSSPAFISHCESFRTKLLSHVFMEGLMGAWPYLRSPRPPHYQYHISFILNVTVVFKVKLGRCLLKEYNI